MIITITMRVNRNEGAKDPLAMSQIEEGIC